MEVKGKKKKVKVKMSMYLVGAVESADTISFGKPARKAPRLFMVRGT